MPGWHAATQRLQDEGKIQLVGILQEQHPDRARLFMQWHDMDWPLMVDSLNLLQVQVVPITLLIDEAGIIRFRGDLEDLPAFLESPPPTPMPVAVKIAAPVPVGPMSDKAEELATFAETAFMWGGEEGVGAAIEAYERLLRLGADDEGPVRFRLGVAYRRRADSPGAQEGDFAAAVEQWGRALDLDPNQYIWRRRIQQYGPRLQKPYPFYDWVETARRDIQARGESPSVLTVEPRGAELAQPSREFEASTTLEAPRNAERIRRDTEGFIELEATMVPHAIAAGESARVHLALSPSKTRRAHWNNEAEDLVIWLEPPAGWSVDRRRLEVANPRQLVSDETRRVELEVQRPETGAGDGPWSLTGYALYYVCEDVRGACLYRRQDITIPLLSAGP